jgi:hypothetical protein
MSSNTESKGKAVVRNSIIAGLCLFLCPSVPMAGASGTQGVTVSACSHDVCMSLTAAARTFPRNALISVKITVTNENKKTIWFERQSMASEPVAEVLSASDGVLYPPPFTMPTLDAIWKEAGPELFPSGSIIRAREYVVLRGSQVRAVTHFRIEVVDGSMITLRTPKVRLLLTATSSPTAALSTSPAVSAVLSRPRDAGQGPLLHVGWYACPAGNGAIRYGGSGFYEGFSTTPGAPNYLVGSPYGWTPTLSRVLHPGCSAPLEWHAVAGWLNQPVADINYNHP